MHKEQTAILPSIHYLYCLSVRVMQKLEPIPADVQCNAGYIPDNLLHRDEETIPTHIHKKKQTHMYTFKYKYIHIQLCTHSMYICTHTDT